MNHALKAIILLIVVIILGYLFYLYKTDSRLLYDSCEDSGVKCYVQEDLLAIRSNYLYVYQDKKCKPQKGSDIFTLTDQTVPEEIKSVATGAKNLLHYRIELPRKLHIVEQVYSIVIDSSLGKIYTGQSFWEQRKIEIPQLIKKDPSYLKPEYEKIFIGPDLTDKRFLPYCPT